ncbi:hypothetical protein OIU80_15380 [Flavobacterium sp. LS1R47]|jgi:hypothetical protein|uniref:Uncharacterized protein n=1 Tax=Flavobacterium frigoritolerans TaxID=2987686 RepID=A0A9X2Z1C2_9FLAO|nr:hypothetical protein [Flavobacterium frigoritolerans]MCV9933664.1 hypothetical protein [Flavobacterium frigoritolerans]
MLKNILKLKGTQKLTISEQKNVNGGRCVVVCCPDLPCLCVPPGVVCSIS